MTRAEALKFELGAPVAARLHELFGEDLKLETVRMPEFKPFLENAKEEVRIAAGETRDHDAEWSDWLARSEAELTTVARNLEADPEARQAAAFLWNNADTDAVRHGFFRTMVESVFRALYNTGLATINRRMYAVYGMKGSFEDARDWTVCIFNDEMEAKAFAVRCQREVRSAAAVYEARKLARDYPDQVDYLGHDPNLVAECNALHCDPYITVRDHDALTADYAAAVVFFNRPPSRSELDSDLACSSAAA